MDKSEEIVMTPLVATSGTLVRFERLNSSKIDRKQVHHMAGGPYKGIVISKAKNEKSDPNAAHNSRSFIAYLGASKEKTNENVKEKRNLRFWFRKTVKPSEMEEKANDFFKDLMKLENFPKDSVSFVKRVLTLFKDAQKIVKIELEMRPPLPNEPDEVPDTVHTTRKQIRRFTTRTITLGKVQESSNWTHRVERQHQSISNSQPNYENSHMEPKSKERRLQSDESPGEQAEEGRPVVKRQLTLRREGQAIVKAALKKKILDALEDVYPNSVTIDQIIAILQDGGNTTINETTASEILQDLETRGMVKQVGTARYVRVQAETGTDLATGHSASDQGQRRNIVSQHEIQLVKNIPVLSGNEQPTVAIVTLLYCEKLAVDAMIDNKTTYVKYKTEGEGQVYTLGNIGSHKVVCTKLPRTGHGEDAMVAAGNSVTRLLGTFNKIESVIMVGVGGGIPCYHDDKHHVRLGDVVVSMATDSKKSPVYVHSSSIEDGKRGKIFHTKSWSSKNGMLREILTAMQKVEKKGDPVTPWRAILQEKLEKLEAGETRFYRPSLKSDQLQRMLFDQLEEVEHPQVKKGSFRDLYPEQPMLHFGVIGSGQGLATDDPVRQMFAKQHSLKALDCGFHAVMESIEGSRIDSFALVRGISDYFDGSRKKEWQPYSALAAAALMRQVIEKLPASTAL